MKINTSIVFCIIVYVLLLTSCTTSYLPPQSYRVETTKEINMQYNEVWQRIVSFIGEYNIQFIYLNKELGLVRIKHPINPITMSYFDCGQGGTQNQFEADVNIVVLEKESSTIVSVYSSYSCFLQYMAPQRSYAGRTNCNSTGRFEEKFYSYITR